MLLVLVRHGDAVFSMPDAKRELSACGREEVERAIISYTDFRHRNDKTVNGDMAGVRFVVSPLLRAQQTAAILSDELSANGSPCSFITEDRLEPDRDPNAVFALIDQAQAQRVSELWLIGHNPLLSTLLGLLSDGELHSQPQLATGEIVELEIEWVGLGCATVGYRA
jgi:phosphohistidine phosphatase